MSQLSQQTSAQPPGQTQQGQPTQIQQSAQAAQQGPAQTQGQQTQAVGREYRTRSYLSQNVRRRCIQRLNRALADTLVLRTQAKYAHWNVKGFQFAALHDLFDDIAEHLEDHVDEVAERITSLGGEAFGTVYQATPSSQIPPVSTNLTTGSEFIEQLADRLAMHNQLLGEDIQAATQVDDVDTADLLNELSREVGKDLWMLEAHLQVPTQSRSQPQTGPQPQQQSTEMPTQQY